VVILITRMPKKKRQQDLVKTLDNNPFATDEELASHFKVSIQTIRLDRMELGIPELRERLKTMAVQSFDTVRSLQPSEVIGEVIELQLDNYGISLLEISDDQVFKKTGIARGHYIFAQANSLAIALINQEIALTAKADIRFVRPVFLNERLVAKAKVLNRKDDRSEIEVKTYVDKEEVFIGLFVVYRSNQVSSE